MSRTKEYHDLHHKERKFPGTCQWCKAEKQSK